MKKGLLYFFVAIILSMPFKNIAQTTIFSAQTGNWNVTTTWVGGVVPTSVDAVVIAPGDTVSRTAVGDTCSTLALHPNATLTIASTITSGAMPCASWSCDVTSTVVYLVSTIQTASPYGNLTFNAANGSPNGDLTVNGNLTITANTVRGISAATGSRTHTVAGDVLLTGTSSRISAVNFTGASTSSCVWNIGGSVKLNGAGSGCRVILWESAGEHAGSATYNIGGNLEITGASSQVQFKSSSGTADNYSEGIINLSGNLVHGGPIGLNTVAAGTGPGLTLNFVGTNPQVWSGAAGTFSAANALTMRINVNINNAAGVTLTAPRGINSNVNLNLINGKLTTDTTNLLTVSGTGTISGGSSSSFVDGPLAYANAAAGAFSRTYPIGKGGIYRPIALSLTQVDATTSTYTAEMFNADANLLGNTLSGTLTHVSYIRYYTITEGAGGSAFSSGAVALNYGDDDGVTNVPLLRVAQNDGSGNWVNLNGTVVPPGTITSTVPFGSGSLGTVFTLANSIGPGDANPLPVELTSFTASVNGSKIALVWTTATEANNSGFEIERASTSLGIGIGMTWEKIGFVKGSSSSTTSKDYSFTDKPKGGTEFQYRLKQIDFDGKFQYSDVVSAVLQSVNAFMLDQNYPNPFNPSTKISYRLAANSFVTLKVYDVLGNEVALLVNEWQEAGNYSTLFTTSSAYGGKQLASGMYFYTLSAGKFTDTKKFILMK